MAGTCGDHDGGRAGGACPRPKQTQPWGESMYRARVPLKSSLASSPAFPPTIHHQSKVSGESAQRAPPDAAKLAPQLLHLRGGDARRAFPILRRRLWRGPARRSSIILGCDHEGLPRRGLPQNKRAGSYTRGVPWCDRAECPICKESELAQGREAALPWGRENGGKVGYYADCPSCLMLSVDL